MTDNTTDPTDPATTAAKPKGPTTGSRRSCSCAAQTEVDRR